MPGKEWGTFMFLYANLLPALQFEFEALWKWILICLTLSHLDPLCRSRESWTSCRVVHLAWPLKYIKTLIFDFTENINSCETQHYYEHSSDLPSAGLPSGLATERNMIIEHLMCHLDSHSYGHNIVMDLNLDVL